MAEQEEKKDEVNEDGLSWYNHVNDTADKEKDNEDDEEDSGLNIDEATLVKNWGKQYRALLEEKQPNPVSVWVDMLLPQVYLLLPYFARQAQEKMPGTIMDAKFFLAPVAYKLILVKGREGKCQEEKEIGICAVYSEAGAKRQSFKWNCCGATETKPAHHTNYTNKRHPLNCPIIIACSR